MRGQGVQSPQPQFNPDLTAVKMAMRQYGLNNWFETVYECEQVDRMELGTMYFNEETGDSIELEIETKSVTTSFPYKGELVGRTDEFRTNRMRFVRKNPATCPIGNRRQQGAKQNA